MTDPAELAKELYAIAGDAWAQANPAAGVVINKAAAMLDQLASDRIANDAAKLAAENIAESPSLQVLNDMALYGVGFVKNGERIAPEDVFNEPASTMSAEEVRKKIQRELYECLCWWGTLPEPQGDVPERYHKWDYLGEIADRLIRAMPLTK